MDEPKNYGKGTVLCKIDSAQPYFLILIFHTQKLYCVWGHFNSSESKFFMGYIMHSLGISSGIYSPHKTKPNGVLINTIQLSIPAPFSIMWEMFMDKTAYFAYFEKWFFLALFKSKSVCREMAGSSCWSIKPCIFLKKTC